MADSDRDIQKCFDVCMDLVFKAGKIISDRNDSRKTFVCKAGDIDLVTETDKEVEELLVNGLKSTFPSHQFIGEEASADGVTAKLTDAPTWIIDPVDGTMNFVHGFPHSCISIALVVDKVTEIGIVYNPMLKQKFHAIRGKGAFYNDKPISVSGEKDPKKALVTTEFGTTRDPEKLKVVIDNFNKMAQLVHGLRTLGSAALNMVMVANGSADVNYEFGVHAWDVAAGDLIVREAGGVTIDPAGGEFDMMSRRVLVASSMELAQEISKNLTQFYPMPRDD